MPGPVLKKLEGTSEMDLSSKEKISPAAGRPGNPARQTLARRDFDSLLSPSRGCQNGWNLAPTLV